MIGQEANRSILIRGVMKETPAQRVRAYAGLAGTLLALVLLTYALAAIPAPTIPAPSGYTPYSSLRQSVTCAQPTGWNVKEDATDVVFSLRQAQIDVTAPPMDGSGGFAPLGPLHAQAQDGLAQQLSDSDYHESRARTLPTGMGLALVSEWTAAPGLSRLHGYRATLLSGDNGVEVVCLCEERDWANLRPAFVHVLQSITPFSGQPGSNGSSGG